MKPIGTLAFVALGVAICGTGIALHKNQQPIINEKLNGSATYALASQDQDPPVFVSPISEPKLEEKPEDVGPLTVESSAGDGQKVEVAPRVYVSGMSSMFSDDLREKIMKALDEALKAEKLTPAQMERIKAAMKKLDLKMETIPARIEMFEGKDGKKGMGDASTKIEVHTQDGKTNMRVFKDGKWYEGTPAELEKKFKELGLDFSVFPKELADAKGLRVELGGKELEEMMKEMKGQLGNLKAYNLDTKAMEQRAKEMAKVYELDGKAMKLHMDKLSKEMKEIAPMVWAEGESLADGKTSKALIEKLTKMRKDGALKGLSDAEFNNLIKALKTMPSGLQFFMEPGVRRTVNRGKDGKLRIEVERSESGSKTAPSRRLGPTQNKDVPAVKPTSGTISA